MLSFKAIGNAGGAAHYFESSDDYYGDENENTLDDALEAEDRADNQASNDREQTAGRGSKRGQGRPSGSADDDARSDGDDGPTAPSGPGAPDDIDVPPEGTLRRPGPGQPRQGPGQADPAKPNTPTKQGPSKGHKGVWMGKGAAALGLHGKAERQAYEQILNGQLPNGQMVRKGKTAQNKDRPGIDFTLSAPKSVSIQALANGDKRIVQAHDRAVRAAMSELEKFAMARKKEGGKTHRENTANLVIVSFRHELSRAQDPQLHTHNVVANMTQRADGEWRALSNEDMLRNVKMVGAFYRATLASELRDLGYNLRETQKGGWELANISDQAIDIFSNRSKDIERLLKARGQDREQATTMQKQIIALASRPKKTDVDRQLLREYWHEMAREANVSLGPQDISFRGLVTQKVDALTTYVKEAWTGQKQDDQAARRAVEFAIEHLAERQGIFSRKEVLEIAYNKAATTSSTRAVDAALLHAKEDGRLVVELPMYQTARSLNRSSADLIHDPNAALFKGHDEYEKLTRTSWVALTMQTRALSHEDADKAVAEAIKRGTLVATEERYTTQAAKSSEIRILGMERAGRGAVAPILTEEKVAHMLEGTNLNDGQRDTVRMILTAPDRIVGVQGIAGSGKSHMLAATIDGIKAETMALGKGEGYTVIGLAPYASQNQELERLGMKSQTLASFLARRSLHKQIDEKTIIFLDESSVVPAHQMEGLLSVVERQKARLVLVGDRKQTQAVEAGKPYEQLQDAGMRVAHLTEIQRQKNETLKAAVVHAANDRIPAAVKTLTKHIEQVKDASARHERIAAQFANYSPAEREKVLVVAGTNDARRSINRLIRSKLGLNSASTDVDVLTPVDLTKAEIKSAASFKAGQIVVPEATYKTGLKKGEQYSVRSNDLKRNLLLLVDRVGNEITIDPSKHTAVGLYAREKMAVAHGEEITMTRNDDAIKVHRGERFKVMSVDAASVYIENGAGKKIQLSRSHDLHMRYSYVSTVHSAQGATNDRVLIDADTKSLTANKAVFYVGISRPRYEMKIYTDDKAKLDKAMSREPKKFAALELRDERNEAFFLKGRADMALKAKHAAQMMRKPANQAGAQGPDPSALLVAKSAPTTPTPNKPVRTVRPK